MNEQLVNALIAALREQTAAQREQTEAINRLAESNVALSDVIIPVSYTHLTLPTTSRV